MLTAEQEMLRGKSWKQSGQFTHIILYAKMKTWKEFM